MIIKDFSFFFKSVLLFRAWDETSIFSHNPEFLVTCKWPVDCFGQPTNPNRARNTIVTFFLFSWVLCTWETFFSLPEIITSGSLQSEQIHSLCVTLTGMNKKNNIIRINHKEIRKFLSSRWDLNPGGCSRKFGIEVCRPGSYTLTLFKDETNENWSP